MSCVCACWIESIREVSAACLIGRTGDHTEQYMRNHHDDGSHVLHQVRRETELYSAITHLKDCQKADCILVLYGKNNKSTMLIGYCEIRQCRFVLQSAFVCPLLNSIELQEYGAPPTNRLIDSFHAQILNQCLPRIFTTNVRLKQKGESQKWQIFPKCIILQEVSPCSCPGKPSFPAAPVTLCWDTAFQP